jgi:hypothetical protein
LMSDSASINDGTADGPILPRASTAFERTLYSLLPSAFMREGKSPGSAGPDLTADSAMAGMAGFVAGSAQPVSGWTRNAAAVMIAYALMVILNCIMSAKIVGEEKIIKSFSFK